MKFKELSYLWAFVLIFLAVYMANIMAAKSLEKEAQYKAALSGSSTGEVSSRNYM